MKNDGAIQFQPTKNAHFYSDLAGKLVRKLSVALNKFNNNSTKQNYTNGEKSCHNFELCNATSETIKKILAYLDASKVLGLNRISSKLLKDATESLWILVNFSLKQSLFPVRSKITKLKPLFKKALRNEPKNNSYISLLPVVSKIIEKTI